MDTDDWWEQLLDDRQADGAHDAGRGVFEPPWPGSDDPQDEMENHAYESGWHQRRKKLGDAFKWA